LEIYFPVLQENDSIFRKAFPCNVKGIGNFFPVWSEEIAGEVTTVIEIPVFRKMGFALCEDSYYTIHRYPGSGEYYDL
jgi:hypothetical protein